MLILLYHGNMAGKFTCLQPVLHPRYPVGTFMTSSKSNVIDVVQMQEPAAGDQVRIAYSVRVICSSDGS